MCNITILKYKTAHFASLPCRENGAYGDPADRRAAMLYTLFTEKNFAVLPSIKNPPLALFGNLP